MLKINQDIALYYFEKFSQIFLSLVFTPFFFLYLGEDAYGLVGFYVVLQNLISKFDFGFGITFSREIAYNISNKDYIKKITSIFQTFYYLIFVIVIAFFFINDSLYFAQWIEGSTTSQYELKSSIKIIGISIAINFLSLFYSNGIIGFEKHFIQNFVKILFLVLKFFGGFLFLKYYSTEIDIFFYYILIITITEFILFFYFFYFCLGMQMRMYQFFSYDLRIIKQLLPFSGSIWYLSILNILLFEIYTLFLPSKISIAQFGYFSLLLIVCRAVSEISMPITRVTRIRIISLKSQGNDEEIKNIILKYSTFGTFLAFAIAMVIGFYKEPLLYAWIKDMNATIWISDYILYFLVGNFFLSLAPYSSQLLQAAGSMKKQVINLSILFILGAPIFLFLINSYNILGLSIYWALITFCFSIILPAIVFEMYLPNFYKLWMINISLICLILYAIAYLFNTNISLVLTGNSLLTFIKLIISGLIILFSSALVYFILYKTFLKNFYKQKY